MSLSNVILSELHAIFYKFELENACPSSTFLNRQRLINMKQESEKHILPRDLSQPILESAWITRNISPTSITLIQQNIFLCLRMFQHPLHMLSDNVTLVRAEPLPKMLNTDVPYVVFHCSLITPYIDLLLTLFNVFPLFLVKSIIFRLELLLYTSKRAKNEQLRTSNILGLDTIFEFGAQLLFSIVEWVRQLPFFVDLITSDQTTLLQSSWAQLFILYATQSGASRCNSTAFSAKSPLTTISDADGVTENCRLFQVR
uniref:NR LBD domain-containing protein n=1 Tax=Heterorhabditis bacteriophora TaxID=37862 RepID=A0A1I7W837_HETBA